MNVFTKIRLYYSAFKTDRNNLFYSSGSNPAIQVAPYAVDAVIRYNNDANHVLQRKRYPVYRVNAAGRIRRCYVRLPISVEKTRDAVTHLQNQILEKELNAASERKKLSEKRFEYQASRAPHLVQRCNDQERELDMRYAKEVLALSKSIITVISEQIQALADAENAVGFRLNQCIEQINTFYTKVPEINSQTPLRIPTINEIQSMMPVQIFPGELRTHMDELQALRDQYQNTAARLKQQLGL